MSPPPADAKAPWRRVLQPALSIAVVAAVFFWGLPQIADFSQVWTAIIDMSWLEVTTLVLVSAWNIATYMFVAMAVLPGLSFLQAFVVGQSSTAVATALPAGSALGVGLTYSMYSSWGRSGPEIALAAVLTGVWNNFVKLGLPIVALALLAFTEAVRPAETLAAVIGLAVLAGAVGLFALMLRSAPLAERVGARLGGIATAARRVARRPPVQAWGAAAVRFRSQTIDLLEHRWRRLTIATLASHLSLYVVLLLALRHMGVPGSEVTWVEALGAFALVRLVTALPVTPGGLGLVALGLVAALVVAGGARAPVVAAVLVFRFLTLIVQVPLGAGSYLVWRARIRRLREGVVPDGGRVAV
jgi:putative heme transporter